MGKRNTVVSKPTVATEPSERHFDESEPSDPMLFEQAVSAAPVTAPVAPAKPAPRPRRVSAEAVKAETRLANLDRATQASIAACTAGWAAKRAGYIASLPHDVQGMLLAGGVITDDDLEGLDP